MSDFTNKPKAEDLKKGLEIIELEERLEMVHLSAVEAEASWKCDVGGGGGSAPAEQQQLEEAGRTN
jgi:hypothetical protein